MTYEERLQHVSVLGAAGKMGSGILLLTAVEMADLSLKPENKGKSFVVNAIDVSDEALSGVMKYLRAQVLKIAEKKAVSLRKVYAGNKNLVENYDIIDQYIFDVLSLVRPTTRMEAAFDSRMIFEAIKEDPEMKIGIFSRISSSNPYNPGSSRTPPPSRSPNWMRRQDLKDGSSVFISTTRLPCRNWWKSLNRNIP